ncbi:hypothetical protein AVEN_56325-1 [Araneus ventricosus]|uniref:Uncharacterized protein n=1 Tax=Araneus ventricosus TaxID=182803 RepID=A0A4Y2MIW3_ARAVE|nr:hypothetical protein AVEN_56325-1 [Araneus ventricosus]
MMAPCLFQLYSLYPCNVIFGHQWIGCDGLTCLTIMSSLLLLGALLYDTHIDSTKELVTRNTVVAQKARDVSGSFQNIWNSRDASFVLQFMDST